MNLFIEHKEDSPEKIAAVAGKPTKHFLFANEINAVVDKINNNHTEVELKEDKFNKSNDVEADKESNEKFPTVKSIYNWCINILSGKENAFAKNTAFNKNFGTVAGTVAQGNDSRILNAFAKKVNAISVTGDSNKIITLTREDGTTITATFLDNDTEYPDDVINSLTFNANNDGVLIAITSEGEVLSVSLDGRYSLLGHIHSISSITGLQAFIDSLPDTYEPKNINTAGFIPRTKVGGVGTQDSALSETETGINSSKKIKGFKAFWMNIAENGFTGLFANGEEGTSGFVNGVMAKWRTNFYGSLFDFSVYRNDSAELVKASILFDNIEKFIFNRNGTFATGKIITGDLRVESPSSNPVFGSISGGVAISPDLSAYGLVVGNLSNGKAYVQVQRFDGTSTVYNLIFQPLGGSVEFGGEGFFNGTVSLANATASNHAITKGQVETMINTLMAIIDDDFVTLDTNQEIDSIKLFLQSPKLPPATEPTDAVPLQQVQEISATAVGNMHVYNSTTVNLTKANLNTLYPTAPLGFEVQCMDIPIKPGIYKKSKEDTWMFIYVEYPVE